MPLKQGKSKAAFSKNVETEMKHGKPQKQALAISFAVQRKNRNKKASGGAVESGSKDMNMAEGGQVNAKNERRPMPDNHYDDAKQIAHNSGKKPPGQDSWTDSPTVVQARKPSRQPLKHPKMVPQSAYTVRIRDEEDHLMDSASPGPYGAQPPKHDDEEGANRQGPKVPDMQDEHSTHRKPYAKGGMIDSMKHVSKHDMEPEDDAIEARERRDESDLMVSENPSEDEGLHDADSLDELDQDRQGPRVPDMEREHSNGRKPYARGGEVSPQDEEDMEDDASIASAIMAKERKQASQHGMSDSDIDEMMYMAHGGEILEESEEPLSHDSIYSDDSDQADLRRNAEEDANEEDQLSFNALRKESYSESDGLDALDSPMDSAQHGHEDEDDHDLDVVSHIRRSMKRRSPITR